MRFSKSLKRNKSFLQTLARWLIGCAGVAVCSLTTEGTTLAWNPNAETNLVGYRLYQSVNTSAFIPIGSTSATSFQLPVLAPNTYRWYVTATNTVGMESLPSNQVGLVVPSTIPCTATLSISGVTFTASGGSAAVNVTTQTGCGWSVKNAPMWITSDVAGWVGSGAIVLFASPNTGSTRTAAFSIAGQSFTVTQQKKKGHWF